MDVLERDRKTREERRGQETKDGGIVERRIRGERKEAGQRKEGR